MRSGGGYKIDGRYESTLTAVDPVTLEIKKNVHLPLSELFRRARDRRRAGVRRRSWTAPSRPSTTPRSTQLWKINVGSGFGAPPMTFEVNGKQYLAIASGPSPTSRTKLLATPELKDQRSATVLYVFGL